MALRLLLVDDDDAVLRSIRRLLVAKGAVVETAHQARDALALVEAAHAAGGASRFDALVTDHYLPPGPTGIWLLENVLHKVPQLARVLFSGQKVPHAAELVRIGVVHSFLRKPLTAADVLDAVAKAAS